MRWNEETSSFQLWPMVTMIKWFSSSLFSKKTGFESLLPFPDMYASTSCSQPNEPRKSFARNKDDKKHDKEKDQFGADGDNQR